MCEGIHLYSLASIYSAFDSMLKIYNVLGNDVSGFENNRLKEEKISKNKKALEKLLVEIKKYINTNNVECDLYKILNGDLTPLENYNGEYMKKYSWAEERNALLYSLKSKIQ